MKKILLFTLSLVLFSEFSANSIFGQAASEFEIRADQSLYYGGQLYITVSGKKRKIAEQANDAWLLNNGSEIVYSARDGAGGFEGEGQSLRIYDVKTGKTRKIMSEYTVVVGLTPVKLSNGASALLVRLGDGGLGASYFAVVDPKRGQVLSLNFAEVTAIEGDKIRLAFYEQDEAWDKILEERGSGDDNNKTAIPSPVKYPPSKTAAYDLKEVLKNKVIYNKTNEELGREYERKYSDLTIYLWRPNDKADGKDYFLMGYVKQFPKTISPLRVALETLFGPVSDADKKDGWESAVFGMKFLGVVLKNGVALIRVSQPAEKRAMPKFAGQMFLEAVERTAKQFPTVKKVEICEVGGASNAFESGALIPKCPAN